MTWICLIFWKLSHTLRAQLFPLWLRIPAYTTMYLMHRIEFQLPLVIDIGRIMTILSFHFSFVCWNVQRDKTLPPHSCIFHTLLIAILVTFIILGQQKSFWLHGFSLPFFSGIRLLCYFRFILCYFIMFFVHIFSYTCFLQFIAQSSTACMFW